MLMQGTHSVYKTFGSQWFTERHCSYYNLLYLDEKMLRNAKRFIYVTVTTHLNESNIL